jgi:CheY-like chemotaxis protein/HPt (histidine-containing phosphotransfer) domain-containing protein
MNGAITVDSQPGVGSTFRFDVVMGAAIPDTRPADVLAPAETDAPAKPSLRVLLAEDNATNQIVALRLLARLGHQAEAVCNGAEAVAALGRTRYDLILMDVMMPEMDGLTATRHIRAGEPLDTHIVIVGLTAGSGPEALAACLNAGMDAVTTKPVTIARLRAAIAEGLAAGESFRQQEPDQTPVRAASSRLRELLDELGPEVVAEIVGTFAEETGAQLHAMRDWAERGDFTSLHRAAHSVAGSARNVGAEALAARAAALEQSAGSLGPAEIRAEIAAMQADLDEALEALGVPQPAGV